MMIQEMSLAHEQHRLINDVYVLLDDGDRRVLAAADLTPLEFAVLRRLDTDAGQRLIDVGAELLCVKSTITRVIDRLERAQLVTRTPDPNDRRAQRVTLTLQGIVVRDQAIDLHNQAVERRMNCLSTDEQALLSDLLAKLRDGLAADLRNE
jgi:MarR family transcriptional regulator, 2-MHQ and catechol-resistance regulon repressor